MATEQERAYNRAYYLAHREKLAARSRAYQRVRRAGLPRRPVSTAEQRRERELTRKARYRDRHRDELRTAGRTYAKVHTADRSAYYQAHRDRRMKQNRAWKAAHPERTRELSIDGQHRRRARIAGAGGKHTRAEWLALLGEWLGRCAYCGSNGRIEKDHRVPISRGGSNAIANVLPACRSCNATKGAMTEDEFRARR